jgi:L-threonylcarbamoyladenylate synthase
LKRRPKNCKHTAKLVRIDPVAPEPDLIRQGVDVLGHGGLLVFPTSGLYGVGADALNPAAIQRIYDIKRRPVHHPILVLLADMRELSRLVRQVPQRSEPLLERLWPGGITFIFEASDRVPEVLSAGTGKIGVRLPAHPVAKALAGQFGGAITATSANLSGQPPVSSISALDDAVGDAVDLTIDAGRLAGGPGSSIVDVTCRPFRIIREGAVSRKEIEAAQID